MRFPQKIKLLICGCLLVLGALCLIQYRLVQNTYRLEKSAYFDQVEQQLERKSQAISDSLNNKVMKRLIDKVKYQLESGSRPGLDSFQQQVDYTAVRYRQLISQAFSSDSLLRDVEYSLGYTNIILYHREQADTLLHEGSAPLLLAGTGIGDHTVAVGKQQAGFPVNIKTKGPEIEFYRLAVSNKTIINASNWQRNVLRRMYTTLAGSVLLIAAVIVIFFMIFTALFRQKKIAEVTTDFANSMTHELKTPLSAAALVVKSLRTPDAKLDEQWFDELLAQLDRQHGKIQRLMDNVLTSAMDRPIGMVQFERTSLKKIVYELKLLANAANRELVVTGETEAVIYTNADLLMAILSNLLDNALKYTPDKSALSLNIAKKNDNTITISLADQGTGIDKKHHELIFHKFFRVPQTENGHIKGLGLGLYLCCMHAEQIDGKLTYEINSGGGSTFNLILTDDQNADITS